MKYYVFSIEQVKSDGKWAEYATKSDPYPSEKQAKSAFYDKCAAVNKDLSENGHSFMDIKIVNSEGGIVKKDTLGKYIDEE